MSVSPPNNGFGCRRLHFGPLPPEPSTLKREVMVLSLIIGPAIASVVYGVSESRRNSVTIQGIKDQNTQADYIQRSELESWRRSLEQTLGDPLPNVPYHAVNGETE